jgi:hypothetical protein
MRHMHALVEAGVYLIENLALHELVRDRLGSFGFILLATKYRGATGCPVRPIALVWLGLGWRSGRGEAMSRNCGQRVFGERRGEFIDRAASQHRTG